MTADDRLIKRHVAVEGTTYVKLDHGILTVNQLNYLLKAMPFEVTYAAMRDEDGKYMGIHQYVQDIEPMIDWYLKQTGQRLEGGCDIVSGASERDSNTDTVSAATANV